MILFQFFKEPSILPSSIVCNGLHLYQSTTSSISINHALAIVPFSSVDPEFYCKSLVKTHRISKMVHNTSGKIFSSIHLFFLFACNHFFTLPTNSRIIFYHNGHFLTKYNYVKNTLTQRNESRLDN